MEEILQTLLQMDPSTISTYVNYFFVAIGAIGLIGFLIGFIKGFYRESSTFFVTAIYFILMVSINKWISESIYTFNISKMITGLPEGVLTVGDFANKIFVDLCTENNITIGNSQEMVKTIISLSLAFINLVVYFIFLVAGLVIIPIIDTLIYLLIVRLIIPKKVRKKRKMRVLGGTLGLLRYIVAFTLLLSPFTAIVNSTIGNLRNEEGKIVRKELDNDFYNAMMNVLEGYNNSSVAQMFFFIKDDQGRSFDVSLMDYITASKLDGEKTISLYTEIGNFSTLAVEAISTGFIESTSSINYSLLLGADFVGSAIETIAKSTLIQTLLSVGTTLAVNIDAVKENVDLTNVDFMNMDWENSLTAVSSSYTILYNSGLIDKVIENPETFMNDFYLDSEYSPSIKQAFRNLGDNDLVCKIMPSLIVSFLSSMKSDIENKEVKRSIDFEIKDELLDTKTYEDIKWGSELASIYETFENLSKQYYAYSTERLTLSKLNELNADVILNTLFGTGIDFSSEEDESYADQYENNVFVNGGKYVNNSITHEIVGVKEIIGVEKNKGFFNLQIVDKMFEHKVFNDFIQLLDINSLLEMTDEDIDINEKVMNVVHDWEKEDWSKEIGHIVDVVAPIMNLIDIFADKEKTISEAKRANSQDEMNFSDILSDKTLNCLKRVTDVLTGSEIFDSILPDILETMTNREDDELIPGLTMKDLNFTYFDSSEGSMLNELRSFIDEVDDINEDLISLIEDLGSEDTAIYSLVNDCVTPSSSVFARLLKIIEGNQIFNKKLTYQEKLDGKHQTFTNIMVNILAKTDNPEQQLNVYNMTDKKVVIEKEVVYSFENNEFGWENEIDGIVGFIGSLKGDEDGSNQVILDYVTGKTSKEFDLSNEIFNCGNEIERIFASVDNSIILQEAFPTTFDNLIGDAFNDLLGTGPKFSNVESWADEGYYFNLMLTNIKTVKGGQDLSEVDWLNVDSSLYTEAAFNNRPEDFKEQYDNNYAVYFLENSKVNKLLKSLYDTQSIGGRYNEETREEGIYHVMLKNILGDALESLEIKIEGEDVPEENIISRDFDIDGNEKVIYFEDENKTIYVSWQGSPENGYIGEIGNISLMINAVSDLDEDANIRDIEPILLRINESYILRNTLSLIIESKSEELKTGEDELIKEFVNRSDFEAFHKDDLSLTPYDLVEDKVIEREKSDIIKTRRSEIETRKNEIQSIVKILNEAEELNDSMKKNEDSEDEFSTIKDILVNKTVKTDEVKETSKIENILNEMHDSKIFNAVSTFTDSLGERNSLTAFEYFFQYIAKNDALKTNGDETLFVQPSDEFIYNLTKENKWINSNGQIGEITKFNNSLYQFICNDLVEIVIDKPMDFLKEVSEVIDENSTPLQDLLLLLHNSEILDLSTGKILDEYILEEILMAVDYNVSDLSKNEYLSNQYIYRNSISKIDEKLSLNQIINKLKLFGWSDDQLNKIDASNIMEFVYKNEGLQIEKMISTLEGFNFKNLDITGENFDKEFIDKITIPMKNSFGLNYLNMSDEDYENNERSAYQLLIIKIMKTSIDAIEDSLNLSETQRTTNIRHIKDYDKERELIGDLVDEYNIVKDILKKDSLDSTDSTKRFDIKPYSQYDQSSRDDLDKIDSLIDVLKESDVYNYSVSDSSFEDDEERNIYQRIVMKLVNTIKDGFNSAGVIEIDPGEVDYTSTSMIKSNQFEVELNRSYNIARKYKDSESLLKNAEIVTELKDDTREKIESLMNELKSSFVFNYTTVENGIGNQDTDDNSYYEHVIIYMINKTNESFRSSLDLNTDEATKERIENFEDEFEIILDVMQAYQNVNQRFDNSDNSINFDGIDKKEFMDKIEKVLEPLYKSNVYHYLKSDLEVRSNKGSYQSDNSHQLSNLTIFEQMIYKLLSSSDEIIENLYVQHEEDVVGIIYPEVISNKLDVLNLRIREVTSHDIKEDGHFSWFGIGGEVSKIHDVTGESITDELDVNNLDITGIVKNVNDSNAEDRLLNLINKSYILHDIIPNIVSSYISTHEADNVNEGEDYHTIAVDDLLFLKGRDPLGNSYQNVRGYAGEHVNSYIIENNPEYSFETKVEHWNNDLYHVSILIERLKELKNAGKDVNNMKKGTFFEDLLFHLSETETYHAMVPQILISILCDKLFFNVGSQKISMGAYILGKDDPEKLITFFELIDNAPTYQDKLIISNGNIDDYPSYIYSQEGQGLDQLVERFKKVTIVDDSLNPTEGKHILAHHIYSRFESNLSLNINSPR